VGVIGRVDEPAAFGFFFGPRRDAPPALNDILPFTPNDAIYSTRFSLPSLSEGDWPIIGALEGWDRRVWAVPVLRRFDELTGRYLGVRYEEDLFQPVEEFPLESSADASRHIPPAGLVGDLLLPKRIEQSGRL